MVLKAQEIAGRETRTAAFPLEPARVHEKQRRDEQTAASYLQRSTRTAGRGASSEYVRSATAPPASACDHDHRAKRAGSQTDLGTAACTPPARKGSSSAAFSAPPWNGRILRTCGFWCGITTKSGMLRQDVTETLAAGQVSRYVAGAAFHWYTGDHFENVAMTAQRFPGAGAYLHGRLCVKFEPVLAGR